MCKAQTSVPVIVFKTAGNLQTIIKPAPMKLKKLLTSVVFLLFCFAASAQEDTSLANVYFVKSKFYLLPEGKDTLKAFIDRHKNDRHLWVVARCDKWGGHTYNDWLSIQRANTVTNFLIANGFPKENIDTIRGYGKRRQLAINATPKIVDDKNRVATITASFAVVQQLIETKDRVPDQFAVKQRPAHIDTTYLKDTIYLMMPYAPELLVTNKFPHKGDILKTTTNFFIQNDSPFLSKKLYVASETMEEPKPVEVAVAPVAPPTPAPVQAPPTPTPAPVVKTTTAPPATAEIAENTEDSDLGRQVKEHLQGGKIGESLIIRGINFDFGYHRIVKKSKVQLEAVLYAMTQLPTLKLEIQGHICCWPLGQEGFDRDTKEYNLSFNRAKEVFDYLVKAGIAADRLTYNGYGMKRPMVFPEKSKDDEYKNRRVEFKIVSKLEKVCNFIIENRLKSKV